MISFSLFQLMRMISFSFSLINDVILILISLKRLTFRGERALVAWRATSGGRPKHPNSWWQAILSWSPGHVQNVSFLARATTARYAAEK